jgi:hypothetical protein
MYIVLVILLVFLAFLLKLSYPKETKPFLVPDLGAKFALCKKEIPHHIKMSANAWSTKYR